MQCILIRFVWVHTRLFCFIKKFDRFFYTTVLSCTYLEVLFKFFDEIVSKIYFLKTCIKYYFSEFSLTCLDVFLFDQYYFHNENFLILLPNLQKLVKLSCSTKSTTLPCFNQSIFSPFLWSQKVYERDKIEFFFQPGPAERF